MKNKELTLSKGTKNYFSHRRENDKAEQSLWTHLEETSFLDSESEVMRMISFKQF
ncbi:MAG: hypothetical protein GX425_01515 [Peptococcaceae bacterium]|nr:hypothetical protein [Peptococcaceae bacterium]